MEVINKTIREFEQGIINYMNNNPLPIEVKRLVLINILQQTTDEANKVVLAEMKEQEERSNS